MNHNKEHLRAYFKNIRKQLLPERKIEAKTNSLIFFQNIIDHFDTIYSFAPKNHEIDIWELNEFLAKKNKLFLPKVEKDELFFHKITDLKTQLSLNPSFFVLEPNISTITNTKQNYLQNILIIVPGLAFDITKSRLGYGGGFYDKFISKNKNFYSIGIGYKEQLSNILLPIECHDKRLNEIQLF